MGRQAPVKLADSEAENEKKASGGGEESLQWRLSIASAENGRPPAGAWNKRSQKVPHFLGRGRLCASFKRLATILLANNSRCVGDTYAATKNSSKDSDRNLEDLFDGLGVDFFI